MEGSCNPARVVGQCKVSPPPGSVPTTSLPLTFFDIVFLFCGPVEFVYFYEFPHPLHHITQTILPKLRHSLSLTLQHFFPLASNLICPPPPSKPFLHYSETDRTSLLLTIAESSSNFNRLTSHRVNNVAQSHFLVPPLPPARVLEDGTRVVTPVALQLTVFPNSGICIGINFLHALTDGSSLHHFMKSWASVCLSQGVKALTSTPPSHNRGLIKDPCGLENKFLAAWRSWTPIPWELHMNPFHPSLTENVRTTFVLSRPKIDRLKQWVSSLFSAVHGSKPPHMSSFVVICALTWVCLVKAEEINDDEMQCYFNYSADSRNRLEYPLPSSYFGNCLSIRSTQVKKSVLVKENGLIMAVDAIGKNVKDLESGVLRGAKEWTSDWDEGTNSPPMHLTLLAGSPRLDFYNDIDFGWGRPKKSEVINVDFDFPKFIYLSNSREEEGGFEIVLALEKAKMKSFTSIFEQALKLPESHL
ncbi:putative transferase [Rosa chinensis]|uniref:Putative transferase n=1 Tax=Rosa chinensis TaxID=74649 RepID=A0A2P6SI75_ROSCH|nr:coumaroyl-CoA:anthocyanidin 3-O-glucoside-6''-O-coumaroyltransferase 1 [Rosa chinensis]PRQ58373.1 putative transferase [Rosa chinensis]